MSRVKVTYHSPKKGNPGSVSVHRHGTCCVCERDYALTKHHVFGSNNHLTMRLCKCCHHMVHAELAGGQVGRFGRAVFQILAQAFPAIEATESA